MSTPTMTRVVTNAAMARTSAPCLRKDAARGKAMKAGMRTIEPNAAAMTTPMIPAFRPIVFNTNPEGRNVRIKPIVQMIATMDGARDRNARQKKRRASFVLSRLFAQDRIRPAPATPQITAAKAIRYFTLGLEPRSSGRGLLDPSLDLLDSGDPARRFDLTVNDEAWRRENPKGYHLLDVRNLLDVGGNIELGERVNHAFFHLAALRTSWSENPNLHLVIS